MSAPVRVLYFAGSGRSGTTVMNTILGQVPGCFAAGELRYLWHRGVVEDHRCACGEPFHSCPVWSQVMASAFGGNPPDAAGIGSSTPVHVAVDGRFAGIVYIADAVRPGAREALVALKATGVKRTVMLTGDNAATAHAVAQQLGIDEVHAELLPEGKVGVIAELQKQGHRVAMVGDGINDAPALARADVGIAMGGGGTQAALEAADVALMTDDLAKIGAARAIARRAYRTVQENLFVGVGVVHVLGIAAALMGWIGPIEAAIIHLGPDVLVFVNSVKLLRVRIPDAT